MTKYRRGDTLRVNELLFINEYLSNGCNGIQAYLKVHPRASWNTAHVEATRVLATPGVRAELARRVRVEQGWTRDVAVARVLDVAARAQQTNHLDTELRAYAELNELAGLKVLKHQDVTDPSTLTPEQRMERLNILRRQYPGLLPAPVDVGN